MKQLCFPTEDGYIICNYVITRAGNIIYGKNGKWLKFKSKLKKEPLTGIVKGSDNKNG
jgi:hypothetical protein